MLKKYYSNKKIIVYLLFVLIIFLSLFLQIFMEREADYYWHIKAGEHMFNNGILRKDIFSWSVHGKYWMSHEWLFEILIYVLSIIFPKTHLLIYGFISMVSLLSILFFSNKSSYLKNIPFTLIWLSFSIIFCSYMQGRPNLISFNFLALTIMLLYDCYNNENSKLIYILPIISILWANIHGGSSNLLYILCLIFYICSFFNFNSSKIKSAKISKKTRIKFIVTFFLCFIATNINIHGYKLLLYPYQNMMDSTMLNSIQEWQPINVNLISHYPYLLLVAFITFTLLFGKRKIDLIDFILFLFSIFLGFKSIRFCCYTYIIMNFVIFKYINTRKADKGTNSIIVIIMISFFSIFVVNYNTILSNINKTYISPKIIKEIRNNKPQRLFNSYNIGGELLYHDIPVFIDSRADLYSPIWLKDYLILNNTSANFISVMNKYDFDYYLVENNSNINYYLQNNKSYTMVLKDKKYLLYKKN